MACGLAGEGGRDTKAVSDRVTVCIVQDGHDGKFLSPPVEWQPYEAYTITAETIPCVYMDVGGMRKYYACKYSVPHGANSSIYQPGAHNSVYWRPVSSIELVVIQKAWIEYLSGSQAFFELVKATGIDTTDEQGKNGIRLHANSLQLIGRKHTQFEIGLDSNGETIFRFFNKDSGVKTSEYNPETGLIQAIAADYSWIKQDVAPFVGDDNIPTSGRPNIAWRFSTSLPAAIWKMAYAFRREYGSNPNVNGTTVIPAGWYRILPGTHIPAPVQNGVVVGVPKTIYYTFKVDASGKVVKESMETVEGVRK